MLTCFCPTQTTGQHGEERSILLPNTPDTIRITSHNHLLEPGVHRATIIGAAMRNQRTRDGRQYVALKLEFATKCGQASLMIPDFVGLIPNVFRALGNHADLNDPFAAFNLRGLEANISVVHRRLDNRTFANVVAINGVAVST